MNAMAEVGSTIVIKGEVTAGEDLVVSGRVEGSISAGGHAVTIQSGAELLADIEARAIVVSGRVIGDLSAAERIVLESAADVEGSLQAPHLRIADGGLFRGKAQTTREKARSGLQLAS